MDISIFQKHKTIIATCIVDKFTELFHIIDVFLIFFKTEKKTSPNIASKVHHKKTEMKTIKFKFS